MERIDAEEVNRPAMADIPPERGFQGGRGEDSLTRRANGLLTFGVNGGNANSFPRQGQGAHGAEANREDGRGSKVGASGGVILGVSPHVPTEWPEGGMGRRKGGHTNAEGGKSPETVGSQGLFPSPTHNRDKGKGGNEEEHPGLIGGSEDGLAYVGTHEKLEHGFKPNPILDVRPPVTDAAREPNFVDRNVQPETPFRGSPSRGPLGIPDPAKTLGSPSHIQPTSQPLSQSTPQQHTNNQFARPSPFSEANNATAQPSFQGAPERPSQDDPFANPSLAVEGGPIFTFPTQNIKHPHSPSAPKEYPRNNPFANPSPFGQGDKSTASAGSGFAFAFSFPPLSQKKTAVNEVVAWHPKAQQQVEAPVPVIPPSPFPGVNLASLEDVAASNSTTPTPPCAPAPAPPVTKAYIVPASSSAGPDPPQATEPASPIPLRDPSQEQTTIAPLPIVGESSTQPAPKTSSSLIPSSSSSSTTLTARKSLADAPPLRSDTSLNSGSDSRGSDKKATQRVPSYFDTITAIEDALEKDLGKRKRRGPLAGRKFKEGVAGSLDTGKKRRRGDDDERDSESDCKRRRMVRKLHPSLAVLARRKKARALKKLNAGARLDPKPWSLFIPVGLEPSSRSLKRQREEDGGAVDPDEVCPLRHF
ncbi:hypothetical protein FA13DRAFT_71761 [Coprinellus micaceus]|uniref:Uncharacterized protein n=1 Tax=Coprinellus micaceus TaxID=71717 RepID=A0A4Y7TJP8_COPMI|nr:hypothetical protein FA13DRAFT_71761 [Coprinellus micaceus]